jgi:hypothetical protein
MVQTVRHSSSIASHRIRANVTMPVFTMGPKGRQKWWIFPGLATPRSPRFPGPGRPRVSACINLRLSTLTKNEESFQGINNVIYPISLSAQLPDNFVNIHKLVAADAPEWFSNDPIPLIGGENRLISNELQTGR